MCLLQEHDALSLWTEYKANVAAASSEKGTIIGREEQKRCARTALELLTKLENSKFLSVYSDYSSWIRNHQPKASMCLNDDLEYVKQAARRHFEFLHAKRTGAIQGVNWEFEVEPKQQGTRLGLTCRVKLHGEREVTKYNFKSHHHGSHSVSGKPGSGPDVREVLVYKLLELIGAGPEADFALPVTRSDTAYYIVTKWREDFIRLDDLTTPTLQTATVVEIHLLQLLLHLYDLKEDNVGQWGDGKTAVVDFFVNDNAYVPDNILEKFIAKNCPRVLAWVARDDGKEGAYELFERTPPEPRKNIAKSALERWNLCAKLDEALEYLKSVKLDTIPTKTRQKELCTSGLDSTPSSELMSYVSEVKKGVKKLSEELRTREP